MSVDETERLRDSSSELDDDSEVDYPLIDLKTGLKNEIIEKTLKDLKKAADNSKKSTRFRASEFSHGVMGQNKSEQFALKKAINYFYSEQEYMIEKMRKAQAKTLEDLKKIHLNKRQQMRMTYEYHNEETRQAILRMKNEEIFQNKQDELEKAMKKKKLSISRLSKKEKFFIKENSLKMKRKLKNRVEKNIIDLKVSNDEPKENELKYNLQSEESEEVTIELPLSKSKSFLLSTKALEVTKDLPNPRTLEMNMNERIIQSYESLPSIEKPSIVERKGLIFVDTQDQQPTDNQTLRTPESLKEINEHNLPPTQRTEEKKFKSSKEIMKERKLMKEKELKDILSLPFIAYRRNSKGKLIELDHPPTRKEFKEPSNKEKYKIRKMIDKERNQYQEFMVNLTKTTENIIQEDIRRINQLNTQKLETKKEPEFQVRKIGPEHWMKAFVSSNIPKDVDPTSKEAIIYCRYIRAPLKDYSHLPNYLIYHTPL